MSTLAAKQCSTQCCRVGRYWNDTNLNCRYIACIIWMYSACHVCHLSVMLGAVCWQYACVCAAYGCSLAAYLFPSSCRCKSIVRVQHMYVYTVPLHQNKYKQCYRSTCPRRLIYCSICLAASNGTLHTSAYTAAWMPSEL